MKEENQVKDQQPWNEKVVEVAMSKRMIQRLEDELIERQRVKRHLRERIADGGLSLSGLVH